MADLIIKSSTGSGNNLLIQGADSSPAITIAETGTTTFAENATLSGTANNLGTSTAGTFTSGVTFPAGHVINTSATVNGTSTTSSMQSEADFATTVVSGSYTPASATNSIKIYMNFQIYIHDTASDSGYALKVQKTHSGGSSFPTEISQAASSTPYATYYVNPGSNGDNQYPNAYTWIDPAGGVETLITYTLFVKPYSATSQFSCGAPNNGYWHMWFQEIQR